MITADILEQYGFTHKEASIYLTCLQLGDAPLSKIARHSQEKRGTVYSVLQSLLIKGYISEKEGKTMSYFAAVHPQKLINEQEQKLLKINEVLPEILSLMSGSDTKPLITFFEGEHEVKQQYLDLLSAQGGEILSFISLSHVKKSLRDLIFDTIMPKRVAKGIHIKVLMQDKSQDKEYIQADNRKFLKEVRIIRERFFSLACQIHIYESHKVSIIFASEKEVSGIVIESKDLYTTLKSMFLFLRNASF